MKKFESKTGYIKRIKTGEVYKSTVVYLPDTEDVSGYEESTKEEYEEYLHR